MIKCALLLTHHVKFPCGKKPERPHKTHNVLQSAALTNAIHMSGQREIQTDLIGERRFSACSVTTKNVISQRLYEYSVGRL